MKVAEVAVYCWPFNATLTALTADVSEGETEGATTVTVLDDTTVPIAMNVSLPMTNRTRVSLVLKKLEPVMLTKVAPVAGPFDGDSVVTATADE